MIADMLIVISFLEHKSYQSTFNPITYGVIIDTG